MKVWFVTHTYADDFVDLDDIVLFTSEASANSHCVKMQDDSKKEHTARELSRYAQWQDQKEAWDCLEENGVKASTIFPWFTEFQPREWKPLLIEVRSLQVHP